MQQSFRKFDKYGVHSGAVVDFGVAVANQVMVSVASDQTVKVHSVAGKVEAKLSVSTLSKNLCIDVHPVGFQVALGFKEGFRVYFYLGSGLRQVYESYCKQCSRIRYSHRGDMLAVASDNEVAVYDPYTFEKIKSIVEHTNAISTESLPGCMAG